MNFINILRELIDEFWSIDRPRMITRPYRIATSEGKVSVVIGVRRSGKTFLLYQAIHNLIELGVPKERILYLNLEDDRLDIKGKTDLAALLDSFYQLVPKNHDQTTHIFLDEIQNVPDWAPVVRRYLDTKRTQLVLTGSSANLLSKEIATTLRGRSISTEVWPLGFAEFLESQDPALLVKSSAPSITDKRLSLLKEYLIQGGFPELAVSEKNVHLKILQDYLDTITFRDIIERNKIKNQTLLRYLLKTLLRNVGKNFTAHKFYLDAKSQGLRVSKNTVHEYLAYIEDSYIAFSVLLYSESLRKQHSNPRKIYAVDTGLSAATHFAVAREPGRLFENVVFLELKRKGGEINYYVTQDGKEVDFLHSPIGSSPILYQACLDSADPHTLKREETALNEAVKETGFRGELITAQSYISNLGIQLPIQAPA